MTFLSVRLMDLTGDEPPHLDLQGRTAQVSAWFGLNAGRLETHVVEKADITRERRRQVAAEALQTAERIDEAAQDYEIIGRELSVDRVSNFK